MPGDHAALARTLRRWLKEPSLLHEMGMRAARLAELYRRDRTLTVYEQELLKLTGKGLQSTSETGSARPLETVCS